MNVSDGIGEGVSDGAKVGDGVNVSMVVGVADGIGVKVGVNVGDGVLVGTGLGSTASVGIKFTSGVGVCVQAAEKAVMVNSRTRTISLDALIFIIPPSAELLE